MHEHNTTDFFSLGANIFAQQYEDKDCFRDRRELFVREVRATTALPAKVLDFGCGPGIIAIDLAKLGYDVLAIDGAEAMVAEGSERAKSLHLSNIRFEAITESQVPAGHSFDTIIC